jgi:hypothetical protein
MKNHLIELEEAIFSPLGDESWQKISDTKNNLTYQKTLFTGSVSSSLVDRTVLMPPPMISCAYPSPLFTEEFFYPAEFVDNSPISKYSTFLPSCNQGQLLEETQKHLEKLHNVIPSLKIFAISTPESHCKVKRSLVAEVDKRDYDSIKRLSLIRKYITSPLYSVAINPFKSLQDTTGLPNNACEYIVSLVLDVSHSDISLLNSSLSKNVNPERNENKQQRIRLGRYLDCNTNK